MKRKVASLPPLTSEIFAEKVIANQANAAVTAARATYKKECTACQKTYFSDNAYKNHLASQRHRTLVMRPHANPMNSDIAEVESVMSSTFSLGEPLDTTSVQSVTTQSVTSQAPSEQAESVASLPLDNAESSVDHETFEMDLSRCLFCNQKSHSMQENEVHMGKQHGMFVPERDYVVDIDGLFGFLHQRIHELHECLYCGQIKHSISGVQTHMRDRGHCMIPYATEEDMLDVGDYYDFRSTYTDADTYQDQHEHGGAVGGHKDNDDDDWEDDASSLSSVPTDEITALPIDDHSHMYKSLEKHRHHSHHDPRPHRHADGYHSHAHTTPHAVYHDDMELHTPAGNVIGHRQMRLYYKQNLRPHPVAPTTRQRRLEGRHDSDDESGTVARRDRRDRGRQLASRADAGSSMAGVSEDQRKAVRAQEKRQIRNAQRAQNRYQAGNERQGNFQRHFRVSHLQRLLSSILTHILRIHFYSRCFGTNFVTAMSRVIVSL